MRMVLRFIFEFVLCSLLVLSLLGASMWINTHADVVQGMIRSLIPVNEKK